MYLYIEISKVWYLFFNRESAQPLPSSISISISIAKVTFVTKSVSRAAHERRRKKRLGQKQLHVF